MPVEAGPLHPRHADTFPELGAAEIERLRRFGSLRRFADGERLFVAGEPGPGMYVLLAGQVAITQADGLGRRQPVVEQGPGQFLAEVGALSGRPALVDGEAEGPVEALLIPPAGLRALLVAEADLGERITRALILRRVQLIQSGLGGPLIIGDAGDSDVIRIATFLRRSGHPYKIADPVGDEAAAGLLSHCTAGAGGLPVVVTTDGKALHNPSIADLARALGLTGRAPGRALYDVAVVGAGPAGLSAAVYAASEGLSVVVLDAQGYGGQAGASARIENYLGFPTGITGQALTGRAFVQAEKFGAEIIYPAAVSELVCLGPAGPYRLDLADGVAVTARSVVIASGARYRRPALAGIERFEGRGVWYWASPMEARLCGGTEVALVGGGNSAGQGAVYLSGHASRVNLLIRGPDLEPEHVALPGRADRGDAEHPAAVRDRGHRPRGRPGAAPRGRHLDLPAQRRESDAVAIRNLFLFIGADPETSWVRPCKLRLDRIGFVLTGDAVPGAAAARHPLETSLPGVFAIGDVRSGSVKRVGGAIGEGARRGRGDPCRARGAGGGLTRLGVRRPPARSTASCACWRGRCAPRAGARASCCSPTAATARPSGSS